MLVDQNIVKQAIKNHLQNSFAKLPLTWANIGNTITATYILNNKIDGFISPFVLDDNKINIQELEILFLEHLEKIKKENPSLIGAKGELHRIPMIGSDYVITEQEVRDLIQEIKSLAGPLPEENNNNNINNS